MPLTKQDLSNCLEKLPHPKDWPVTNMDALHECEDGVNRKFSFSFNMTAVDDTDIPSVADVIAASTHGLSPEIEADGPQGDDGA